jgi:hypothetical protein
MDIDTVEKAYQRAGKRNVTKEQLVFSRKEGEHSDTRCAFYGGYAGREEDSKTAERLAKIEVLEEVVSKIEQLNPHPDNGYEEGRNDTLISFNKEITRMIKELKA